MNGPPINLSASLGEMLASVLAQQEAREAAAINDQAQYLAAVELARQIAPLLRVTEEQAFEALTYVPDSMLPLLQSPEGWAALAAFVAADLGVLTVTTYAPTRH